MTIDQQQGESSGKDDARLSEDEEFEAAFAEASAEKPSDDAASAPEGDGPQGGEPQDEPEPETGVVDTSGADEGKDKGTEADAAAPAADREVDTLKHELKSNRGRIAAYQRQIAELEAKTAATEAAAKEQATAGNEDQGEDPDIQALNEEYPEISGPVAKLVDKATAPLKADNERMSRELAAFSDTQRQENLDAQEAFVRDAHSDFDEVAQSDGFMDWLAQQPAFVQQAARRNGENIVDGSEAAHLITLYKQAAGIPIQQDQNPPDDPDTGKGETQLSGKRQRQLKAGASVSAKSPSAGSGPADDFDSAFAHYAARQG